VSVPDPYKVLQIEPDASDEIIEAAYKRLAKRYHPDVAVGPDAQQRMVRINQARDMLRDPIRRAAVDRARVRAEGTSARVAAADGRARAAGHGSTPQEARVDGSADEGASGRESPSFPGAGDPGQGGFYGRQAGTASTSWPPGRSTSGHVYDASTMGSAQGTGAAGPPPGNPSGSRLNFGRYSGWTLGEVARTDLEYLEWLDRVPIGRIYQAEIDVLLRKGGRRTHPDDESRHGLYRRR
jgi:curved DNA-binding protein CbpA